jgi:hyaluronoglucosaminidase
MVGNTRARGAPGFGLRGVIKGFYGRPWSAQQRLDVIPRLARYGFNVFVYGPKDDPYICERWREPYAAQGLAYLGALKATCDAHGMALWVLLAPGFSISYADPADFQALLAKYRQVYGLGVRRFGLLFDDIAETLQHPADQRAFTSLVEAHLSLSKRVYGALRSLDAANALVVCPTEYWGDGRRGYLPALGRGLPPEVGLFYTGDTICAHTLDADNARRFAALTGRQPLYWDNYPVNDANMTREFHIAPLTGRSSDLWQYAQGLVANPMEHLESSLIALYTIGDYLTHPTAYDPEASHARAIADVVGPAHVPAVRALSQMCYKSALTRHGEQFPPDGPGSGHHQLVLGLLARRDGAGLLAWARETGALLASLEDGPNRAFLVESGPWRASALAFCHALEADLLTGRPEALCAYRDDPQDVMQYEARLLIEGLRTGSLACAT